VASLRIGDYPVYESIGCVQAVELSAIDIQSINAMRSDLLDTNGRVIGPPYGSR